MLLVMILAVPLAGAAVLLLLRKGDKNIISVASAAVLALTLFLLKNVFGGGPVELAIHLHGPYAPVLRADPISAPVRCFGSIYMVCRIHICRIYGASKQDRGALGSDIADADCG